jgi:hypothetical protein
MAHTPGPWFLEGNWDAASGKTLGGWVSCNYPAGCPVFGLEASVGTPQEIVANARLIAAAPDMLAALKEAFAELQCVRDYIEDASRGRLKYRGESEISVMATGDLARVDATIDAARAAIAKAEGRA